MTGNAKEQDPSIFSDPAVQPVYPPQTVLVRWKDDLLLLDAWDPHGRGLRTPPSLISEALAHYDLGPEISDYRLAIRERVDGVPRLLYLGISAIRLIEDGRVLELVKVVKASPQPRHRDHRRMPHRRKDSEDTLLSDSQDSQSVASIIAPLSAVWTSSSSATSTLREQASADSTAVGSDSFVTAPEHLNSNSDLVADLVRNAPTHPFFYSKNAHGNSDTHASSSPDHHGHCYTTTASSSVPPSRRPSLSVLQEAEFAQPSHKLSDLPDLRQAPTQKDTQSIHSDYQDDGSSRASPFNSPSTSPSRSRYHSRTASRESARLRQAASLDLNGDLWLGAQGIAEWEREHRERVRRINETNRGRSTEKLPRPRLSSRSTSDGTLRSDISGRPAFSRLSSIV